MERMCLKEILNDYEANLCDRIFLYELANNKKIRISFFREQFCHLTGLQHVYGNDKHFLGENGYRKILNETITINKLKKHNKKGYNEIKERLKKFYIIPEIMKRGYLIKIYKDRAKPKTKIQADFIFYLDEQAYIAHLFLRKESLLEDNNMFAPVSFVIKSITDDSVKQFIENQEYKKIYKRSVIVSDTAQRELYYD